MHMYIQWFTKKLGTGARERRSQQDSGTVERARPGPYESGVVALK